MCSASLTHLHCDLEAGASFLRQYECWVEGEQRHYLQVSASGERAVQSELCLLVYGRPLQVLAVGIVDELCCFFLVSDLNVSDCSKRGLPG